MKGKIKFTINEKIQIRDLIEKKVVASKNEQKSIRNKIRRLGFYYEDFSNKKGYNIDDFDELVKIGKIEIIDDINPTDNYTYNTKSFVQSIVDIEKNIMSNFVVICDLDEIILDNKGFYCIKLKENSRLPERYQVILNGRDTNILYIGKAENTLKKRLKQELEHKEPGTFFRSIGCVLGYIPMKGHLVGMSNQNNFKFSPEVTNEIIEWLKKNVEVSILKYEGDFKIEKELIEKYRPLLNTTNNPLALQELKEDRKRCRNIARGNYI